MSAEEFTPTGAPKVSAAVLRKMSGSNPFGEGVYVWCGVCVVCCMVVILSFPCLVLTSTSLHLLPFPVLLSLSSPLLFFCPSLLPPYPHCLGDTPATHTPNCPHYFPLSSHTLTPHTHTHTHIHTHTHTSHNLLPPLVPFPVHTRSGADAAYGSAYAVFGSGEEGRAACQAIGALANIGQIDSTITNFLIPLQVSVTECW
jgi:hypothetical protein